MDQDGRLGIEQRPRFLDATARLEQSAGFVGDTDVETEVIVGLEIIDDLFSEMMHIDDNPLISRCLKLLDDMPQQRLSPYPHECLGHRVGERLQSGSQTCSKDHRLLHQLFTFHFSLFTFHYSLFTSTTLRRRR